MVVENYLISDNQLQLFPYLHVVEPAHAPEHFWHRKVSFKNEIFGQGLTQLLPNRRYPGLQD
jgi:hypothetical protein